MKFVFTYEETRQKDITIDADNLAEAMQEAYNKIDNKTVLDEDCFFNGQLKMNLEKNFLPQLERYGENMENVEGLDIILDMW